MVDITDTVATVSELFESGDALGIARHAPGSALGLTYEQYRALDTTTLASERTRIHSLFEGSRPHYLIDTLSDLPEVIADINKRLANGEMPQSS